jgi:predicted ATPase
MLKKSSPTSHELSDGREREKRLVWLSIAPFLLILGFCIWHFHLHRREQAVWRQDRAKLSDAYSKMAAANLRDDMNSYFLAVQNADTALNNLQTDLGKRVVTVEDVRRERILQGSKDCVKALSFALTPPKSKPDDYCVKLIANDNP